MPPNFSSLKILSIILWKLVTLFVTLNGTWLKLLEMTFYLKRYVEPIFWFDCHLLIGIPKVQYAVYTIFCNFIYHLINTMMNFYKIIFIYSFILYKWKPINGLQVVDYQSFLLVLEGCYQYLSFDDSFAKHLCNLWFYKLFFTRWVPSGFHCYVHAVEY